MKLIVHQKSLLESNYNWLEERKSEDASERATELPINPLELTCIWLVEESGEALSDPNIVKEPLSVEEGSKSLHIVVPEMRTN